jgi:short-subunit dehydrogenase
MSRFAKPQSILITGATGGIGKALAEIYAAHGVSLILHGRNEDKLREVAASCEAKGARVLTHAMDVRDTAAWMAWVESICYLEKVDLAVANAGLNSNIGPDGAGERWDDIDALIDVNIKAAMATANAALPSMRQRRHGQIVLMSSLAAYFGLPLTPSYSASKAALKAYGEALRGWLAPQGIRVNVVMPGYVRSKMCDEMPGPKPFLWSAEKAAGVIQRALAADKPRLSFPFPLNFGCWGLSALRPSVSEWILKRLGYGTL